MEKEKEKESKVSNAVKNDALKHFILFCYLGLNIFVVIFFYFKLRNDPQYHYLYLLGGPNLMASRAFGAGLNFNCLIILLPMNKIINSYFRTYILKYFPRMPRRTFDHNKGIHILCAYIIAMYSMAHTILHLVNAFILHDNYTELYKKLNAFESKEATTVNNFLRSVPGWTGLVLLIVLAIIFITAFKAIRRKSFETFLYCHQLAWVFLIVMCVHGLGMVTKKQINLDKHPIKCHNFTHFHDSSFDKDCKEFPIFEFKGAATWKWLLLPLILHFIERVIRYVRALKECKLVKMAVHDGSVVELLMYKKGFNAKAGQYIRVNVPDNDMLQFHAFTLTKTPTGPTFEEQTFSVHIKACGGWTQGLLEIAKQSINDDKEKGNVNRVGESCLVTMTDQIKLPTVRVDGPYGSPNQDGFTFPVNISIAAGIGITPYACMLNALKYYDPNNNHKRKELRKMYLIWACRGLTDFNWLVKLMFEVEERLKEKGHPDFLECILHVTQGYKTEEQDGDDIVKDFKANDIGKWLKGKLVGGRPKFKEILTKIGMNYYNQQLGVFFCGPPVLGHMIEAECNACTVQGNQFLMHMESFG